MATLVTRQDFLDAAYEAHEAVTDVDLHVPNHHTVILGLTLSNPMQASQATQAVHDRMQRDKPIGTSVVIEVREIKKPPAPDHRRQLRWN